MAVAPQHILAESAKSGIRITPEGDMLRVKAQGGRVPPALLDRIRANKPSLLAYLRKLEAERQLCDSLNHVVSGDCLVALKRLLDNSVDLLATDPPYGYGFMGKDWDKALPNPEIWKECLRVLKPGAFAFIMAAPRQDVLSRMIIALEESGFVTGFTSLYWTYAAGFPKAHNIGKAVDKRLGAKRKVKAEHPLTAAGFFDKVDEKGRRYHQSDNQGYKLYEYAGLSEPATEEAKTLDGSYAGFQPKPAVEVILVVMKPLDRKGFTDQALHSGKGITWLDDCQIPYGDELPSVGNRHRHDRGDGYGFKPQWQAEGGSQRLPEKEWRQDIERQAHEKGRFPANLLVSDGILDNGREYRSGTWNRYAKGPKVFIPPEGDRRSEWKLVRETPFGYSRFFSLDAWADLNLGNLPEAVQRNLPYLIVPKASKREKDAGLETIVEAPIKGRDEGTDVRNVPQKNRPSKRRNIHPTVKPIQLMAYLVTMGSREGDIVLDPFAGSGSTLIAAQMLNRRFIGIEMEPEYQQIAVRRLAHHAKSIANEDS